MFGAWRLQFNSILAESKKGQAFAKLRGAGARDPDEVPTTMNTLTSSPVASSSAPKWIGWTVHPPKLLAQPKPGRLDKTDERASAVTSVLYQMIQRQDSVPRWGINE